MLPVSILCITLFDWDEPKFWKGVSKNVQNKNKWKIEHFKIIIITCVVVDGVVEDVVDFGVVVVGGVVELEVVLGVVDC